MTIASGSGVKMTVLLELTQRIAGVERRSFSQAGTLALAAGATIST